MKVYVATSGEYDQFGVDGVFSTREKADEYIREQSLTARVFEPAEKGYIRWT